MGFIKFILTYIKEIIIFLVKLERKSRVNVNIKTGRYKNE